MSRILISTDSTADLSEQLLKQNNIEVFSLTIVRDSESLRDGIDIKTPDIFEFKEKTGRLTTTSAGNIADYEEFFLHHLKEYDEIIHFTISSDMSSSYANAKLGAEEMDNVYVIDSRNLSTGIGLQVLKACDLRDSGKSAKEIVEYIGSIADKVRASFVLDTLDYMKKGGRCSSVVALGANLLKLKPCIEVHNGKMDVAKKYRGKISAVYTEYVKEQLPDKSKLDTKRVFVTHTCLDNPQDVKEVVELVKSMNLFDEVYETVAGCSVSVHCGPGTLGVLFIEK